MPWDTTFGRDAFGEDDTAFPSVINVSPTPGTPIDPDQAVALDMRDEVYVSDSSLVVTMGGVSETVWDGYVFTSRYRGGSSILSTETETGHNLHFVLVRSGGWSSSPTFEAVAIDTGENEAV